MKHLKLILAAALIAAIAGCSGGGEKGGAGKAPAGGGGEATYESCITKASDFYKQKSQGNMTADQIKTAAEGACSPCKADKNACKTVIDNLK